MSKGEFINLSEKEIKIYGRPINYLEKEFGLPLHVYQKEKIRSNIKAFKQVLHDYYPNSLICYAAKACTHKEIFKICIEENIGSDVASENELLNALNSGVQINQIVLNGNCKEDKLIELALSKDIIIAVDSIEEFFVVSEIAKKMNKFAKITLRLSGFNIENATTAAIFTAGKWTKFGVNIEEAFSFLKQIKNFPEIDFLGFQVHIGSQITEVDPYLTVLGRIFEICSLLRNENIDCKIINLGGGYPVSYISENEWNTLLRKIHNGLSFDLLKIESKIFVWNNNKAGYQNENDGRNDEKNWLGEKFFTPYPKEKMVEAILKGSITVFGKQIKLINVLEKHGNPKIIIEPGRSLIEDAGLTLVRVGYVRKVAGHNLTSVEMGITSHGIALLDIPVNKWIIATDHTRNDVIPFETFIAGNLCFSGDMISKYKVSLQRKPVRGDILLIKDTGAYSANYFAGNPNSFGKPGKIMFDENDNIVILKKTEKYEDVFRD